MSKREACSVPAPGAYFDHLRLLAAAKTVILVRSEAAGLRVQEVLKGDEKLNNTFLNGVPGWGRFDKAHYKENLEIRDHNYLNDFNSHKEKKFWNEDIGRSPFYCCLCAPSHSFPEGHSYLLFPEFPGAMKSAELINSKTDEWYTFIKRNVKR